MKRFIQNYESQSQRLLEILPGLTTWTVILFPLWGGFFIPKVVAYFTIAFLVYWFYRSFQGAALGLRGYLKIRQSEKINWYQKYLKERKKDTLVFKEIKHLVLIPNYNESVEKISRTLDHLAFQQNIKKEQMIVVLAMEERAKGGHQRAKELVEKYQDKFGRLLTTFHPDGIAGEVRGKASNEAWAAKETKRLLVDQEGEDIKKIVVTTCDADACFHPRYFSALTYTFIFNPNRYLRFWQSPIFNHNNFWKIPAFVRIVSTLSNVLHLSFIQEPTNLFLNYSTYSLSLLMLDKVGYWDTDIIPEDWHIFLQCFFRQGGKVEVEPIFLPTSIDAPEGKTYLGSLKNRYQQCKRHAWGASDIPYAVKQAILHPEIPFWTRFFRVYKIIECHLLWPTNWFILTLGAWLPPLVNPLFSQTTLGYNLPRVSQFVLTLCLAFLLAIIVLDLKLRPKKIKTPLWLTVAEFLQWIFMPIATLFMAILPALDSQTRLLLGKRLEYKVTEKI